MFTVFVKLKQKHHCCKHFHLGLPLGLPLASTFELSGPVQTPEDGQRPRSSHLTRCVFARRGDRGVGAPFIRRTALAPPTYWPIAAEFSRKLTNGITAGHVTSLEPHLTGRSTSSFEHRQ